MNSSMINGTEGTLDGSCMGDAQVCTLRVKFDSFISYN